MDKKGNMRTKTNSICSGIALLIILALLAGCRTSSKDERSDGRYLDDKEITSSVKKSLKNELSYKFTDVGVDTYAGVVQLSGFVNTSEQKARAEDIARGTAGVKSVANGLTLKPINVEPTGRTNVAQRIYAEPQNPVFPQTPGPTTNQAPQTAPQPK